MNLEAAIPTPLFPNSTIKDGGGSRTNSGSVSIISGSLACSTVSGMASRINSGSVSKASGFRVLVLNEVTEGVLCRTASWDVRRPALE